MKVLHVHSGNMWGGVETVLTTLFRNRAFSPSLLTEFAVCYEGKFSTLLVGEGAQLTLLNPARVRRPDLILSARRRLREVLKASRPDVVIVHSSWSRALFGSVVNAMEIPLVHWVHDALTGQHWLDRLSRRNQTHLMICNSRFVQKLVRDHQPLARTECCYYPITVGSEPRDAERRETLRHQLGISHGTVVLAQSSRFQSWKGHAAHVRALAALKDLDVVSWFIGAAQNSEEGAYMEELKTLADDLGVAERIRWMGHRSDVPALLEACDILCQPNESPEPFGIAFVEAMAAGVPVVTSAIGGAVEVVDDTCGVLVPAADHEALSEALRSLVLSAETRRRLGSGGPHRASMLCDVKSQMTRVQRLLESVV